MGFLNQGTRTSGGNWFLSSLFQCSDIFCMVRLALCFTTSIFYLLGSKIYIFVARTAFLYRTKSTPREDIININTCGIPIMTQVFFSSSHSASASTTFSVAVFSPLKKLIAPGPENCLRPVVIQVIPLMRATTPIAALV